MIQTTIILLLASISARAQLPAGLMRVGNAAAVRGAVLAFQPARGSVGVVLGNGKPVYLNDVITTDKSGLLQIMLRDETIFTLGPDSSMTLDKFVYDPSTNVGELTANVAKGAFRFISGKIAKKQPSNMKVKLPVGTIGIEGTIVSGAIDKKTIRVVLEGPGRNNNAGEPHGQIWVENNGAKVTITRSGFAMVWTPEKGWSLPFLASDQMRADMFSRLSARSSDSSPTTTPITSPTKPTSTSEKDPDQESGLTKATVPIPDAAATEIMSTVATAAPVVSQSALPDGPSLWDQVRQVPNGTATFAGAGNFTPSVPGTGTWDYNMNVDFGARNIAGGAKITINGSIVGSSVVTGTTNFGAGSSHATFSFASGGGDTYSFLFQNAGGTIAKQLVGNVASGLGTGDEVTTTR